MKISEIFYSIEGEGILIGKLMVFIRLAGCNLRCDWCDTQYALGNDKKMNISEILNEISRYPCKNVSITGGEPLIQRNELYTLIMQLKRDNYWIQINTNGTKFDEEIFNLVDLINMDGKCPSSGMKNNIDILERTKTDFNEKTQFKFIIMNKEDYKYAKRVIHSLQASTVVFQPEWHNRTFTETLVDLIKNDLLSVRVILQQHKMIWGEKKGV